MNTKIFWSRVKTKIKEKGITQQDVAKACNFSFYTFRNWMTRNLNPPLIYAHRISKFLGVSLEYLISGQSSDYASKLNEKVIALLKEAEDNLAKIRR